MSRFSAVVGDRVAEITFDDGGMNLLSLDALLELRGVLATLSEVELLVFRSGRANLFAAGADMKEMAGFTPSDAREFSRLGQELFRSIERAPFLTAAFIDGDCFGGALDMAMSFDLRWSAPRSRFAHPGSRIGLVTGFGGTHRWRRLLAPPDARRMMLGNDVLDADEALEAGLIDSIIPVEKLHEATADARKLDCRQVRFARDLILHGTGLPPRNLHLLAGRLHALYFSEF
jgi:enoyl-CoA hydratase